MTTTKFYCKYYWNKKLSNGCTPCFHVELDWATRRNILTAIRRVSKDLGVKVDVSIVDSDVHKEYADLGHGVYSPSDTNPHIYLNAKYITTRTIAQIAHTIAHEFRHRLQHLQGIAFTYDHKAAVALYGAQAAYQLWLKEPTEIDAEEYAADFVKRFYN